MCWKTCWKKASFSQIRKKSRFFKYNKLDKHEMKKGENDEKVRNLCNYIPDFNRVGVLLLLISVCAPQTVIDRNISVSARQIAREGVRPRWFDTASSAQLDNWTDANILIQCKSMSDITAVFTNPAYGNGETPVDALQEYVQMDTPTSPWYYSRYWMGFRAVLRWLFVFYNFHQIRRYVAMTFFVLLFLTFGSIIKHLSLKIGYLFAFSMLLVRPYVICASLQFSCCFFIAFFAMLLVPWINKHEKYETLFFMELGLLTMYFDFYTTPVITFGLPMTYLYLLRAQHEESMQISRIGKNASVWLVSYIAMWLSKLVLTELFTTEPAFRNAFSSAAARLLVNASGEDRAQYSILNAFIEIGKTLVVDWPGMVMWGLAVLILVVVYIGKVFQGKIDWTRCKKNSGLLFLAVLPIMWFCITAQPIVIHAWFQYRGIVVAFWSLLVFYFQIMDGEKKDV